MKKLFTAYGCLFLAASAFAQSHTSMVGTWKQDNTQSNSGSEPAPKSVVITVLKDTPQLLSWRVRMVDAQGKVRMLSWHGPEDGSMHALVLNGKVIGKESGKKDDQGALIRHVEASDGSTVDGHATLSDDGNTITDEITEKSKDGKETKQKGVFHRVRRP